MAQLEAIIYELNEVEQAIAKLKNMIVAYKRNQEQVKNTVAEVQKKASTPSQVPTRDKFSNNGIIRMGFGRFKEQKLNAIDDNKYIDWLYGLDLYVHNDILLAKNQPIKQ